jgi:hypothetical protein
LLAGNSRKAATMLARHLRDFHQLALNPVEAKMT